MYQKSLIPMCLIVLCLLLEFPISTVADNAVPTEQEFIKILKASEEQITSIAAKVKISNTAVQKLGYLAQGKPDTELDVVFVPEDDLIKVDILRRVPSKYGSEPHEMVRERVCKKGPELKAMNLSQNQGNRKVIAKKYGRYGNDEAVFSNPTPWVLTGWLPQMCYDTPLHKILTNEGNMLTEGKSIEILNISDAPDFPGNVILVEMASKYEVYLKYNIWFDMDRSVRPVRIEAYHDTTGYLSWAYNDIELSKVEPGLFYPTKAKFVLYKIPNMTYDKSVGQETISAMDRAERWEFFQKEEPPAEKHIAMIEVENLVLNATYPPETFQVEFPSKMTVWDAALQTGYKMP